MDHVARLITISDIAVLLAPSSPTGTMSRKRADTITRTMRGFPEPTQFPRTGRLWDYDEVVAWIRANRGEPGELPEQADG